MCRTATTEYECSMIETPPDVLTTMGDVQTAMWQRTSGWKLPTNRLNRTNGEVYAAENSPLMSIDVGKQTQMQRLLLFLQ